MELKPRQQAILEAAGAILSEESIGGLTIKKIAHRVGIVESALYRHYRSKEEIVLALLHFLCVSMEERLAPISKMADISPDERLRRLFSNHVAYLAAHPHFLVVVFSDGLCKYNSEIKVSLQKLLTVMHDATCRIILDGQQLNLIVDHISADELTHILMGSFRLLMLRWRLEDFAFDIIPAGNRQIEILVSLIFKQ